MKLTPRIAVAALVLAAALYLVAVNFVISTDCTSYQVREVVSPDQAVVAEYVNTDCYSSDGVEANVYIYRRNNPGTRSFAFIAGAGPRTDTSLFEPTIALDLVWLSNSELQISFPRDIEPKSVEGIRQGIKVTYQRVGL